MKDQLKTLGLSYDWTTEIQPLERATTSGINGYLKNYLMLA